METIKVSSKYQIVIPSRIRKALNINVGQKVKMIAIDDRIEIIPVRDVASMQGFIEGIDTSFKREGDRL